MAVYVDDAYVQARVQNGRMYVTSRWCHLTADSTDELVAFGARLGLRRGLLQHPDTWKEHFDVTEKMRRKAVALGAQEETLRQCAERLAARVGR